MIRLILSVIIVGLLITYAIIPLMSTLRKITKKEAQRIDNAYTKKLNKDEEENV